MDIGPAKQVISDLHNMEFGMFDKHAMIEFLGQLQRCSPNARRPRARPTPSGSKIICVPSRCWRSRSAAAPARDPRAAGRNATAPPPTRPVKIGTPTRPPTRRHATTTVATPATTNGLTCTPVDRHDAGVLRSSSSSTPDNKRLRQTMAKWLGDPRRAPGEDPGRTVP